MRGAELDRILGFCIVGMPLVRHSLRAAKLVGYCDDTGQRRQWFAVSRYLVALPIESKKEIGILVQDLAVCIPGG